MLKALDVGSNAAAHVFWTELEDCYIFDYYTILWTIVSSTAISSNSGDTACFPVEEYKSKARTGHGPTQE